MWFDIPESYIIVMIKISIVIPIYNREETLRCCLDSICTQTIDKESIEILLVDDCSTDKSFEICKEYESVYSYIRAFQTPYNTKGPSVPRNIGIENAKGEFLFFVDSDDWLGSDCLRRLLSHAERTNSDYVAGRVIEVNRMEQRGSVKWMREQTPAFMGVDYATSEEASSSLTCWAKLIKRSLMVDNNIIFPPELNHYEDYVGIIQVLHHAEKIYLANDYDYYYLRRDDGVISLVSEGPLSLNKRPESQYKAIDTMFSLVESYQYNPDHMLWVKLFVGPVRLAIFRAEETAKAELAAYQKTGDQYAEKIWERVRSHYTPAVRRNMKVQHICWFDTIEAGLGFERYNNPILYYLKFDYPEKKTIFAMNALSEIDLKSMNAPQFLSEEAKIRLLVAQAVDYQFYCSVDTEESEISGNYHLPFKISDDFTVEMKPRQKDDFEPVEVSMTPAVWGEAYQEKGIWKAAIKSNAVKEPRELDAIIKYQGIVIAKRSVRPWDGVLEQPKKDDLAKYRKKLDEMQKKLTAANDMLSQIKNSRSWKMTQTMRKMTGRS